MVLRPYWYHGFVCYTVPTHTREGTETATYYVIFKTKGEVFVKKILLCIFAILIFVSVSSAASLYITTIRECTPEQVTDTLIEVLTGKNFTIDDVTPYKVSFNKSFPQGLGGYSHHNVVFNLIERDGNVKMMVSQKALLGVQVFQRSIDHLVPIIKEVRNSIDGTPFDAISNEAVNQLPGSGHEREKKLGITIGNQGPDGLYKIVNVDPGSAADDAGLFINDTILEINGRVLSEYDKKAVNSYISNKWGAGSSLIMLISHDGEQKMVTLRKD
jgi:hypothetical protein